MNTFKARGIVLKEFNIGESDKIITVFAKEYGRISVSARGARKPKSKFLAATQPFCYADFVIFEGKSFYSLSQVELIESFYTLRTDLQRLSYGAYFCELIEKTLLEGDTNDELLLLLLKSLQSLCKAEIDFKIIARVYELKLLELYGFMPNIYSCSFCQCEIDSANRYTYYFDTLSGGIVCHSCLKSKPEAQPLTIKKPTLSAISYILESSFNKAIHFYADESTLDQLKKVTEQCLLLFLDIGGTIKLNSISFMDG